jgi:hypothetical protein
VSEVNPADLSAGELRSTSGNLPDDAADAGVASPGKRPEREGLPASYRMRADAHYVDQILSRSDATADVPAPRRGRTAPRDPEPAERSPDARERREPRDPRAERVLTQLATDVSSILSAAAALAADSTPLGRRVSTDLLQSQAWRAAWLIRAAAIVDGTHRWSMRPRNVGMILGRVRDRFASECRLAGVSLQIHASDWSAMVSVDEGALEMAVSAAIIASIAINDETEGTTIRVTCTTAAGELRTIEVAQDGAAVPAHIGPRFFDPSLSDRPGGWLAAFAAAAARAVAQQHDGSAVLAAGDPHGSTIRLTFYRTS